MGNALTQSLWKCHELQVCTLSDPTGSLISFGLMLQVHLITYSFTLSIIQTICDTHLFCSLVDPADSRQGKLLKERSQGVKEAMAHQPGDVFHRHLCFEGPNHPPPTKCTHPCLITWEIWTIYVDGAWDLGGLRLWAELFFFLLVWLTFHFLSIMSTGAQHTQAYVLHVEAGFVWPMFFAVLGEMFFLSFSYDCSVLGISQQKLKAWPIMMPF